MTEQASGSSSPVSTGPPDGQTQFCLCQPEPKIPRPRNAFILYRQHQQAAVVRSHPGLPNPAVSKIIGEQWSHLPEQEKDKWKALAEEEKARHAQQYPEYRYQPRRNGRYSSASSGSGPPSGGKVDQNGLCLKCGGKTMNPPATPYTVSPALPVSVAVQRLSHPQLLTYTQGHRPSQPLLVSPPRTGIQPHGERGMWVQPPHRDTRYDPCPRYMSEQVEGPDLKRRRFDSGYVSTREIYRDVPPPYPYSPRDTPYGHPPHPDMHHPRSTMVVGPPSRMVYPQAPPHPPKLQPIRPPPPQHKRNPSLTLPPLSTPTQTPSGSLSAAQGQNSGLEAMIMSIPVLNKVKILSQISPHLAAPGVTSPPQQIRGAIVAVEGLDPRSVWSMTNSLAEQLTRDGKFSVKIFTGPDPFASLRTEGRDGRKELAIADCLSIIGEWHKISEEMKKFITTRPITEVEEDDANDVEMSGNLNDAKRNSIAMTDAPSSTSESRLQTTPTRNHRPTRLNLDPPENDVAGKSRTETTTPPTSGKSAISPKTIVTSKTAGLTLSTPPNAKDAQFKNPWSRIAEGWERDNPESPPYTRIPHVTGKGGADHEDVDMLEVEHSNKPTTVSISSSRDKDKPNEKSKETHVHFASSPPDSTQTRRPSDTSSSTARPSLSSTSQSRHLSASTANTIPIALVPHYQLSTVDASAIAMPIADSYSPLAHWQWLGTLWRGCVGPDVSVVIKSTATAAEGAAGAGSISSNFSGTGNGSVGSGISLAISSSDDNSPSKPVVVGSGPRTRTESSVGGVAGQPGVSNSAIVGPSGSSSAGAGNNTSPNAPSHTGSASAASPATGPGVEVRLLDCRAVVVRTNVARLGSLTVGGGSTSTKTSTSGISNASGNANTSTSRSSSTLSAAVKADNACDESRRTREEFEFWEKAKRRVGFEVAEFLRR